MARRTHHMLEAFKVSREQAIAAQEEALAPPPETITQRLQRSFSWPQTREKAPLEPAVRDAATGEPVAKFPVRPGGVQPTPPRPLVDFADPRVLEDESSLRLSPWTLVGFSVTLATLSFVLGWQIGHKGASQAGAGALVRERAPLESKGLPDPGAYPGQIDSASPEQALLDGADLAFQDPSNHFTLVVDQYNDNPMGRERAIANYRYLRGQGFPVVQPRLRGDVVYLLVGAAIDRDSLAELLTQVQGLPYPGSQDRTFSSAYLERIENFF